MIFFQRPDNFSNRGLVIDLSMGLVVYETGGLYYKILRICYLREIDKFRSNIASSGAIFTTLIFV